MARLLLKTLFGLVVLTALWDGILTFVNLRVIGFGFEANPIVKGVWTLVLVKVCAILLAFFFYVTYEKQKFDHRHTTIMLYLALIIGQAYGGYSHIPIIQETREAESITVGNGTYTLQKSDGSSATYTTIPKTERTVYYSGIIFFLMILPMMFSKLNYYLTRKTSPDLTIIPIPKVKT